MRTGLVIGGGGTAGVSWAIGLLAGLAAEAAFSQDEPVAVIGTSAGSIVGANVAAGSNLEALVEAERSFTPARDASSPASDVDLEIAGFVFDSWTRTDPMTNDVARSIGERAAVAPTTKPERWVEAIREWLPSLDWPERLAVTTTDVGTGQRAVWTAREGVPLDAAVAASCAVPSIAPVIEVGSRPHMDGGVTSVVNADLLVGYEVERALLICPQVGILKGVGRSALARETRLLEQAGIPVTAVVPGADYEALGPDLMNPALRPRAVEEGLRDAKRFAAAVTR